MQPKWITSMEVFAPLILPVLDLIKPQRICEIGAAEGGNTKLLYEYLKQHGGKLITVDPFPRGSFVEWVKQSSDVITHVADYSLMGIPKINHIDAWFVDGDHNWYTVYNELRLIDLMAQQYRHPAIIFMHDISWPCARRDMYYDASRIPPEYVHPHSSELGILPNRIESVKGGFRGPKWALKEGGPKNGVLTAVEDFQQMTAGRYHWINVPAILGLGVLVDVTHPMADKIMQHFAPYNNNPLIALLEQDRVANYIAAIVSNDKIAKISSAMEGV